MINKINKYLKLVSLLIINDKLIIFSLMVSVIIGSSFLLTFTSLSENILKTRQCETVEKYGSFLVVIANIDENEEFLLKKQCKEFKYDYYGIAYTAEQSNKSFSVGRIKENLGEKLGLRLLDGQWPRTKSQVAVEAYILDLYGLDSTDLPVTISVNNGNELIDYEVTGIVSNYSFQLSAYGGKNQNLKVYPSVILGGEIETSERVMIISQKNLNFEKAREDIENVLSYVSMDKPVCVNERLNGEGYVDNLDIIFSKKMYTVILNILFILELTVFIKSYILRNKKTLYIFETFGLLKAQKRKLLYILMVSVMGISFVCGYICALLFGSIYVGKEFEKYKDYYLQALNHSLGVEVLIGLSITLLLYIISGFFGETSISNGINAVNMDPPKNRLITKIDVGVVITQLICIFFSMISFYCIDSFQIENTDIEYELFSKRDEVMYPLGAYDIALYGENYFDFEDIEMLNQYKDYISIETVAETQQSTILLDKGNDDYYFSQYYCYEEKDKLSEEDMKLWNQLSKETEKYTALKNEYIQINVLSQEEFDKFILLNEINYSAYENNDELACVLCLPGYDTSQGNQVFNKNGTIHLGGIRRDKDDVKFFKEDFAVAAILTDKLEENNGIELVISEETAKKSETVVGYNQILLEIEKDAPLTIQRDIEDKIYSLIASTQGGMLGSSKVINERNDLLKKYGSILGNTMTFFGTIVVFIYILLSTYIDMELRRYEYGIMRSFGMSNSKLQKKIFLKYTNSIVIAMIISICIGWKFFGNTLIPAYQITISIGITTVVTYLCRIVVLYRSKGMCISKMLRE